jgi:hypothetical protein
MSSLYVYGVAAGLGRTLGRGMKRERLRAIRHRALSMIVGEMEAPPLAAPDLLRAHDAAVRRLSARSEALLPARFGSVVADEAEARRALRTQAADLAPALRLVRGCVQMTLRVFGTAAPPPASKPSRPEVADVGPGLRYLLARAQEQEAAQSLPEIEALRRELAPLVRAERIERHGRTGLVGTAYHLVERGRLSAYRAAVRRASPGVSPLRLHLSGPWAPYAFGPAGLA